LTIKIQKDNTYSKNQVKKAGIKLIDNMDDQEALNALSYWRNKHEVPLQTCFELIEKYSKEIDKNALVAKRLKRTPSIISKLRRFNDKGMKLITMQDIGGCRVVLSNTKKVDKLVRILLKNEFFVLRNNYIKKPKEDGYRSVHLVGKFKDKESTQYPIELQVRTKVQHSWATAIEIVDLFTNQSIKTNAGDKNWAEFFKHVSSHFEILETNPHINTGKAMSISQRFSQDIRKNRNDEFLFFRDRLWRLTKKLDVLKKFDLFRRSLHETTQYLEDHSTTGFVLIIIKSVGTDTFEMQSEFYKENQFAEASAKYLETEKISLINDYYVSALVSTNAIGGIKEAYPNYFADSTSFLQLLAIIDYAYKIENPGYSRAWQYLKYKFLNDL